MNKNFSKQFLKHHIIFKGCQKYMLYIAFVEMHFSTKLIATRKWSTSDFSGTMMVLGTD